ncbi:MAG: hypothetical protein OR999_10750 [Arenicellales bacterium]|nr:hypothetical protein [Arenicellales bacterium]
MTGKILARLYSQRFSVQASFFVCVAMVSVSHNETIARLTVMRVD